jgi:hypothetical protein
MIAKKFNLFILKFGTFIHSVLLILLLLYIDISLKNPIFWAFLLNHIMFSYFLFIRGCAFGIRKTIDIISQEEATKAIQEEINKNN